MPGVICSSVAGLCLSNGYCAISLAGTVFSLGKTNCLVNGLPVRLIGSSSVPILDVAPLSATMMQLYHF